MNQFFNEEDKKNITLVTSMVSTNLLIPGIFINSNPNIALIISIIITIVMVGIIMRIRDKNVRKALFLVTALEFMLVLQAYMNKI